MKQRILNLEAKYLKMNTKGSKDLPMDHSMPEVVYSGM